MVSFNILNLDPMYVATELERRAGIACRPGWHCAGLAHRTLGTDETGTVRLSPGEHTKMREIEVAIETVAEVARAARSREPGDHSLSKRPSARAPSMGLPEYQPTRETGKTSKAGT